MVVHLCFFRSYMLGMDGTLCKCASRWFCWFTQGEEGWCMLSWGYFSWLYWTTLFEEWCMLSLEALLCYWRLSILIHIDWPTWTPSLAFHECTWVWGSDHPYYGFFDFQFLFLFDPWQMHVTLHDTYSWVELLLGLCFFKYKRRRRLVDNGLVTFDSTFPLHLSTVLVPFILDYSMHLVVWYWFLRPAMTWLVMTSE